MIKWIKKNQYLAAGVGIMLLMIVGFLVCSFYKIPMEDTRLERPSYQESNKYIQFYAMDESGEEKSISLELLPKTYSEEEARTRFEECFRFMKVHILGENEDWDHIQRKLDLSIPEGYEDLDIMIYPAEPEYIDYDGNLLCDEGKETSIYLSIAYESYSEQYEITFTMMKEKEGQKQDTQEIIRKLEKESYQQSYLNLPEVINGNHYTYYRKLDYSGLIGLGLVMITLVFFLWYRKKAIAKKEDKERREQMEADYPDLISKFLIYLKAGMSVSKTWQQIVADYNKQSARGKSRYLYEEMRITAHEIELGLGERKAYLIFGKRCGQQSMIRFGSLLEQNLRKGTSSIMNLLEAERIQALEHKKQEIKASGELAGIKLMMPMMLLFGLVMVIIMVPSFVAFGI